MDEQQQPDEVTRCGGCNAVMDEALTLHWWSEELTYEDGSTEDVEYWYHVDCCPGTHSLESDYCSMIDDE